MDVEKKSNMEPNWLIINLGHFRTITKDPRTLTTQLENNKMKEKLNIQHSDRRETNPAVPSLRSELWTSLLARDQIPVQVFLMCQIS